MNLTETERLILINQHDILSKLGFDKDKRNYHRSQAKRLRLGFFDFPTLRTPVPTERLDFAREVIGMYMDEEKPFLGFEDRRLNEFATTLQGVKIWNGTPPSDDEYRQMLKDYEAELVDRI